MSISKLVAISSAPLGQELTSSSLNILLSEYSNSKLFATLLQNRNGFFAFESALHVFPFGDGSEGYSLEHWNSYLTWKSFFDSDLARFSFFAEDIFGVQFGVYDGDIVRFDPETGLIERFASNIEEWSSKILSDFNVETGYPLAHEWQIANRPLAPTERLLPKKLFMFGGKYELSNLYPIDAIRGMHLRGDIYNQVKNLPDGTKVKVIAK